MQGISPCIWFEHQAEEAANYYVSVFPNSTVIHVARYGKAGAEVSGRPERSVMTVTFKLDGHAFMALNGGPAFKPTPAVSFIVNCATQDEVDRMWEALSAGGEPGRCGWVTDRFGVVWQIVPTVIAELMEAGDARKSSSMMGALLTMSKLDIAALKAAYDRA